MKFSFQTCVIVLFASLIGVASCKKLDDEPEKGRPTLISRLYISFSDYRTNNSIKNLMIVDPADTNTLNNTVQYLSPAKGGGPVLFDPNATSIFQASSGAVTQDTFIQRIPLDDIYGNPGNASQLGFTGFRNVRGLAYYTYAQQNGTGGSAVTNFLLAATGGNMLYAISRPEGKGGAGGSKIIDKQISLGDIEPASLTLLQGNPADKNEKWVLIGFNDEAKNRIGFAVYKGLKQELIDRARDTIINKDRFEPALTVYVEGKKDLRAVSYAPNKKLFAVATGKGEEVLFFRNPIELFNGTGDKIIRPDYVIGGSATGLEEPAGVAIDDRIENGKFFYVSDAKNRKISRFKLEDQGNTAPELTQEYGTLIPNYIFLDAREATNF